MSRRFLVLCMLSLPLTAAGQPGPNTTGVRDFPPASEFDLARYEGRIVVINFWATWCLPCRQEIPHLVELDKRFAGRGLQVIGVSVDRQGAPAKVQEQVRRFARKYGIEYPLFLDGDLGLVKRFGDFAGIPRTLLLDGQGRIVHDFDGAVTLEELVGAVEPLLQPPGGPQEASG